MLPEMLNIRLGTDLALAESHIDTSRENKKNKRKKRTGHRIGFSFICCNHTKLIELRSV